MPTIAAMMISPFGNAIYCAWIRNIGVGPTITGRKAKLEIVHTGPNACLKKLILQ
jgi:hypothetical protein